MTHHMVKVDKVSKKFCRNLRRSLWYGVKDIGAELVGRRVATQELRKGEFWALRDVSFQVDPGETLGLIGPNGAGKTTMLRILNGLIKPDEGRVEIRGRMQALIALGAGFNPILTGRENIFVNASILGIPKTEIRKRFDAIVDFSGIEEFIDMPVQSYSSGMTVRLGFAIAAHLEPDILLVDEVLAVGDLDFKTKCQLRIQELKHNGVAIILVSHSLHTISHICTRAITLGNGGIIFDGQPDLAIDAYRSALLKHSGGSPHELRAGTGEIQVRNVQVMNQDGVEQDRYAIGDLVRIRIHYQAHKPVKDPVFNITLNILNGYQVTGIRTDADGVQLGHLTGEGYLDITIPNLYLLPNAYTVDAIILHDDGFTFFDRQNNVAQFRVKGGTHINGTAYLPHTWRVNDYDKRANGEHRAETDVEPVVISPLSTLSR